MKQTVEEAARIEREKVIQELHVAYKMHKDPKHYIISNAAIQNMPFLFLRLVLDGRQSNLRG